MASTLDSGTPQLAFGSLRAGTNPSFAICGSDHRDSRASRGGDGCIKGNYKTKFGRPGPNSATLKSDRHVVPALKLEVTSSLGRRITISVDYWQKIVETKHPIMRDREELVKQTLTSPEHVRRSKKDPMVYLYYRGNEGRLCCVVAKHMNGDGFVVTTYLTDKIKAGEVVA